ncbi:box C/D snoRNA protein 1-like [Tubulanus polymorphus]|uniref:box C/D snoRNA protein 1-like n=1 Tax=Tubulanus polymorphus TaxID=672921 RepID=UPI003DA666DE
MENHKSCEVCLENHHKYTCPGCRKKSCSLQCVKKHKEQTNCTGRRDKTAYVKMAKFDDLQLLSDYRFLEEVDRVVDIAKRDYKHKKNNNLNKFQKKIFKIAKDEKITLKFMPKDSTKRRKNRLFVLGKTELLWFIEWKFVDVDVTITQNRVKGNRDLMSVLRDELDSEKFDPVIRYKLKPMLDVPMENWVAFLKAEQGEVVKAGPVAANYHSISLKQSVLENLKDKVIIEYPTFHVCLHETAARYQKSNQSVSDTDTSEEDSESEESDDESEEESSSDKDDANDEKT